MSDKAKLLALADAVEKLTGPNLEVDAAIFQVLNPTFLPVSDGRRFYDPETVSRLAAEKYITRGTYCTPSYTASLDSAMKLIPADWNTTLRGCNDSCHVALNATSFGPLRQSFGFALAPAIALTAAALRAQAEALA